MNPRSSICVYIYNISPTSSQPQGLTSFPVAPSIHLGSAWHSGGLQDPGWDFCLGHREWMGKNHGNFQVTFDGGFKGSELNSGLSIAMFARYMENIWRFRQPRCFEDGYSYLFIPEIMGIQPSNMGIFHGI